MAKKQETDDCCQAPQDPIDKHGPKYDNDTPSNWLRGMPSACDKPGFDHTKKGK